ncbi:hypothetical protein Tco_0390988 [Tanacetum coccineum]
MRPGSTVLTPSLLNLSCSTRPMLTPLISPTFVINSTHLKMISENKFDGYLQADPHDHIREFLVICDMFKYGETQSEAVTLLIFPLSLCDKDKTWFHEPNEDEPTQAILDGTARGIFIYKTPNQAFQFLDDKALFKLDWSTKSQNEHHQKSVAFADGSNSNDDSSRLIEKLEALTIKIDSQFLSLKDEMHEMCKNYNNCGDNHVSKNHMNDDTPMCERHEVNSIQSGGYQNLNFHDSYSHQSQYYLPQSNNDSEKSLT